MSDKNYANSLLNQGYFLGDTSGKTKNLEEKSVFAICSNKIEFTVKFESNEKKKIYRKLKNKNKKFGYEEIMCLMHAVKIYYAINGLIDIAPGFSICCDGFNQRKLTRELQRLLGNKWDSKKFNFQSSLKEMFGKHNIADKLAYEVNKNGKKANLILKEKHFRKLNLF